MLIDCILAQSDMVEAMAPVYEGKKQLTMFSAADNETHARIRRPVAGAYSMTSIMQVRNQMSSSCLNTVSPTLWRDGVKSSFTKACRSLSPPWTTI